MAGEPFPPVPPLPAAYASSYQQRVSSDMNRIEEHDGETYDGKYDEPYDEKYEAPTLDTFNTLNTLAPTHDDPNGAVTPTSQRAGSESP
ncbi:hypothetical protein TrVGV298_000420 [Trichoderma virens]|nr:hypothetical protein TrVGV298_000420 [Trichoderma virens]